MKSTEYGAPDAKPLTLAEQIAARLPASATELPLIELIAFVLAAKKAIEEQPPPEGHCGLCLNLYAECICFCRPPVGAALTKRKGGTG